MAERPIALPPAHRGVAMPIHNGIEYRIIPPALPTGHWTWIVHWQGDGLKSGTSFMKVLAVRAAKQAIEKLSARNSAIQPAATHSALLKPQPADRQPVMSNDEQYEALLRRSSECEMLAQTCKDLGIRKKCAELALEYRELAIKLKAASRIGARLS